MVGFSLTFLSEELCVSYQLEKKKHNIESCELFHLGHNEGYSLGDSITGSTEKLTSLWTPASGSQQLHPMPGWAHGPKL